MSVPDTSSEDRYRARWSWDTVKWGTHCLNCLATCPYRVFVRDGQVVFEEAGAPFSTIQDQVPDLNPMGCQKGVAYSLQLTGADRVTQPLRRVGERGGGSWEAISWREALDEVADAILEAIDFEGPESIIMEETVEGGLMTQTPLRRFAGFLGVVTLDANGLVNDLPVGQHITFGKFSCASTMDDTFLSELILVWHSNPAYTWIPYFHYQAEARYNGSTVVTFAPDVSPSAGFSDIYVPVKPGSDAALALAMCQVIVDEDLMDEDFVLSQTDLPLLVQIDTGRYLRGTDVAEGEREDRFYHHVEGEGVVAARRDSLVLDNRPSLTGTWTATLVDGSEVEVTTVFELLKTRLADYTPERASDACGVEPSVIRDLARMVASKRTKILEGYNTAKYYHGDLMERSMCLLLGLTGNWGRPGTGIQGLALAGLDGSIVFGLKTKGGAEETARVLDAIDSAVATIREQDPDASEEIAGNQMLQMGVAAGTTTPPVFLNYYHGGYADSWNRSEWGDPAMTKSFGEYLSEAVQRGWWGGLTRPGSSVEPQVFFAVGTNPIRRTRGGSHTLLRELWPKLEKIVVVDSRLSATALHADIVLPAAMQYERPNLQYAITHTFQVGFSDKAVEPQGEAKTEWEIFHLLCERIEAMAAERGMDDYLDGRRRTRHFDGLVSQYTVNGAFTSEEAVVDEWLRDSAEAGTLPLGTSIDSLRSTGTVRAIGLGSFAPGQSVAGDVAPDKVLTAFQWHTDKGVPFPTLTRRAQFYVDHPWFVEADEALPRHKEPPNTGGDHPFMLTSGHARWTVHSISMGNDVLLGTHRGQPLVVVNAAQAAERGIEEGDEVRVFNDHGEYRAMARLTPRVRPGQVITYNGFEPHMFPNWRGSNEVEPGMVKWLHLVGRYGHLRYLPFGWQPVPTDRAVFVDIERSI